ncbi:5742_t:CDS:2 [Acaulospora morrowiae]|uniref:5742_t:CDS:1 n=1 Tax=Acaulospora morrowiae TaxID=94023 RepID=A0A9N8ZRW0_9GLOM|nr:5742_t:CDS:2 [Acaulospora morrowiae]
MQPPPIVYQQPPSTMYQSPPPTMYPSTMYQQPQPTIYRQPPPVNTHVPLQTLPPQTYSPINQPYIPSIISPNRSTVLIPEPYDIPPTETTKTYEPPEKDAICLNCSQNKVDTDTDGFPSEYCSDDCRREALTTGFSSPCIQCKEFPRITGSEFCGWQKCRNLPMCLQCKTNRVYPRSLWCSRTCRDQTPNWQNLITERSNQLCLSCNRDYALSSQDFCGSQCERVIRERANGQKYRDIMNQFRIAWKHPHKSIPEVDSVWKIYCTEDINARYNIYRAEVEQEQQLAGKPFPKGDGRRLMSAGNEQRRFHGTKMSCFIGLSIGEVCADKSCSVCCIIKEGYKLRYVGTGTISAAFQRFGRGIYFSGTSSKSDDYNEGSLKNHYGTNYKVMILNKVVVGKGYPLTRDNMTLTSPPPGYNSVLGEPSDTGNLNYDEVVVYREEASIPQYLIVYKVA